MFGEREKNAAKTRAQLGRSLACSTNKTASYAANLVVILPINTIWLLKIISQAVSLTGFFPRSYKLCNRFH